MKNVENKDKRLQYDMRQCDQENSQCSEINDISVMVHKKKVKIRKNVNLDKYGLQPAVAFRLSPSGWNKTQRLLLTKYISLTEVNNQTKLKHKSRSTRSSEAIKKKSVFNTKFVVNRVSGYHLNGYLNMFHISTQKRWKVYRCQLSAPEDGCCCSCNSDAMFEVMKSLYDCYKKKNCDNCNCVLCSHLLQEERRLGEVKKSIATLGRNEKRSRIKKAEKILNGKTLAEKEEFLKELAKTGQPLPQGKTASEKALIKKVKAEVGVPDAKTATILDRMKKDKASKKTSEHLKKAQAAGPITPLEGKTPEQKENILKGLAIQGLHLPEAKNASEKKLIAKVRAELGLPPEPKTASMKEKYAEAADAGLLQPLEGKSPNEKERILQGLHDKGIPLPEGRTATEKAIIAKVKAGALAPSISPSAKQRKAKPAGFITPIEGKRPEQQEKILKGLATQGLPLPEGKTASDKKVIEKVRAELGLPPEPKTASMKEKYTKAAEAGLLQPLEGKSPKEKERILQGLHDKGMLLPQGRTASEKALIAKVKAGERAPFITPSAKLREAKVAGLLTPLEGKAPSQKENIVKGLAMRGLPLPEGKTASEKKIMEKVRADLGLPPEPKSASMKEKYAKAADTGLLQPLEGKKPQEKEKILQGLHEKGIPLPEGRTASEKAIIAKVKARIRAPSVTPSEKLRKAKAAGLLTPLERKTPSQKENKVKGLAMQGMPLPEGKTASEKKLIEKVRADLGLPPEPKTASMKQKYAKAADAGLLQPLEGKSMPEKEKILKGLHDTGIPLPEGRTASEKAIIAKVKAGVREPSVSSSKLRKAKAAGLLKPLEVKTLSQKEKIMKGLVMQGLPLPERKTASEKKLSEKVRAELGLPLEPKTPSMKEKYEKAASAGILQPLEGKSPSEKGKILQSLQDKGIPLPEGRTASEKALIAKVKAASRVPALIPSQKMKAVERRIPIAAGFGAPSLPTEQRRKLDEKTAKVMKEGKGPVDDCICGLLTPESVRKKPESVKQASAKATRLSLTPERLKKARAAGLLTPIKGKTPSQKEKIVKGLAIQGLPLPEGRTASEKKLIDKIRADLGLPPEPKTPSMKEKYAKAAIDGLVKPLEGKSQKEKKIILKDLHDSGIPLPEGRTPSDKALIVKVKAGKTVSEPSAKKSALSITTEKLKMAKAAGILTPLKGKTPEQKEKILKGLVQTGLPLPQGKTASEKAMIKKIKTELRIPEKTSTGKMRKAKKSGLLTPLEGKTHSQKEKILRGRVAAGLPLPVGRTPSERALIQKIKEDTGYVSPTPAERLKRAKDAGLLTPLEGKTPSAKEKILRDRVAAGVPIPEGKTPSEKEIVRKITAGEPPSVRPSEKIKLVKTTSEKEKILKSLHKAGKPLPEGKTASEKELIAKVKAESKVPSKVTSEKLRKAKEAGLLTPLSGKSPNEKERILKGLIEQGLPLPESQTASDKKIAEKVRKEIGLPPEPKTLSEKTKMHRAEAAGIVTPLEGKTPSQKERIVRGMFAAGLPLPEGRTASEKSMIKKVKAEEKLAAKAAAGLPLEGKTPSQKEKNIKSQAEAGIPLPVGRTLSEKALIQKVRTELGMPPLAKTISEKQVVHKAKEEGLLISIAGKSTKEKDRILKGLAEAGLPIPEGKTTSEKELVKKIRAEAGLPPEPTASEKRGEIKTKSKKFGISPSKRRLKTIAAGVSEKFEDIIKTTTCDRGCGCNKKKIKFKHSYIKIRVTSPDISSLCDCPEECIPGVKAGAFIDNEGIKVTVGRVNGATSFTSQFSNHSLETPKNIITLFDKVLTDSCYSSDASIDTVDDVNFDIKFETSDLKKSLFDACPLLRRPISVDKLNTDLDTSCTYTSSSYDSYSNDKIYKIDSDISNYLLESSSYKNYNDESDRFVDFSVNMEPSGDICRSSCFTFQKSSVSYDSIQIPKSESSLSLNTVTSDSMDVTSVISSNSSYYVLSSTKYLYFPVSSGYFSNNTTEETERIPNKIDYSENDDSANDTVMSSETDSQVSVTHFNRAQTGYRDYEPDCMGRNVYFTYLLSETKLDNEQNTKQVSSRKTNNGEPVVVISNLDSEHDITTMVDQLLLNNEFSDASSIFVVVPTSDDNDSNISSDYSTICIQLSKHYPNRNQKQCNVEKPDISSRRNSSTTRGLKISAKGKQYCMEGMQETVVSFQNIETMSTKNQSMVNHRLPNFYSHIMEEKEKTKNKLCQISTPYQNMILYHGVSTDTTSDRPCCCAPKKHGIHIEKPEHLCVPNAVSELVTPPLVNQGLDCDEYSRLAKINMTQQASTMSINRTSTSVSQCAISPCLGHPGCHHPSKFIETPLGTPMPKLVFRPNQLRITEPIANPITEPIGEPITELKPVSSDTCQCSPEKMKELFELVLKGKAFNLKSTGCDAAADPPATDQATKEVTICKEPQPLELVSDSDGDDDCGKCSRHKYIKRHKKKCTCSGKSRTIKIRPLCPCEQHQPPVSKTTAGPKAGTRSRGCQCCCCNSKKKGGTELEVLGPAGGVCQMDLGGTYCQAGQKPSPDPKKTRKDCACVNSKRGKKNKNIICECPPSEESKSEPENEPYLEPYLYQSYHWVDEKQIMRQKSDMTQTQSGFRILKKKKAPVPPEPEFTVEDAVRYYVSMNPDLVKDFCPPPPEAKDCPCAKISKNKNILKMIKNDVLCECPPGPPKYGVPPPVLGVTTSPDSPTHVPPTRVPASREDEAPSGGFKFSIGGKGSGSKGLKGVCCFDMIQETNISCTKQK